MTNNSENAATADLPEGATAIRYYIQKSMDGNRATIFRVYEHQKSLYGERWIQNESRWRREEDIMRRYWNGFDADMDDASEEEVVSLINSTGTSGNVNQYR